MTLPLIAILGETASGKSDVAVRWCLRHRGEVLSADSMQVYRDLRIGTAVLPEEERRGIPHHLIGVRRLQDPFSAGEYLREYNEILSQIRQRRAWPVLVGGTGLYVRAVLEGLFEGPPACPELRSRLLEEEKREGEGGLHRRLERVDPETAGRLPPRDIRRIVRALEVYELTGKPISSQQGQWQGAPGNGVIFGLRRDREDLMRRIEVRVDHMLAAGWMDEVQSLLDRGLKQVLLEKAPIGYAEMVAHVEKLMSLEEARALVIQRTRQLAKKQRTWFKAMKKLRWIDVGSQEEPERVTDALDRSLREEGAL